VRAKEVVDKIALCLPGPQIPIMYFDHIIMLGPYITRLELCFKRSSTRESVDVLFLSLMKGFPSFLQASLKFWANFK
jgi:hypothetical protein